MNPALRLVAACCRWPDDAIRRGRIAAAAQDVDDWNAVLALAEAHRVGGLVADGMERSDFDAPAHVRAELRQVAARVRADALAKLAETIRISQCLDRLGIQHRILKGVPLAILAYGTPTIKQALDIDVLVRPETAVGTAEALAGLGYRPLTPPRPFTATEFDRWSVVAREAQFQSARAMVDLHWDVSDQPLLLAPLDAFASERRVKLLGQLSVPTLTDAPNFAYLAAHGAFHGWSRLKWLADFSGLLAAYLESERLGLCRAALACGPGRALDQSLLLVERLFGPGIVPSGWRPANPAAAAKLADLAEQIIAERRSDSLLEYQPKARRLLSRSRWLLGGGVQYLVSEARRRSRMSETRLRLRLPLPKGLQWAYWPMRLPGELTGRMWRAFRRPRA